MIICKCCEVFYENVIFSYIDKFDECCGVVLLLNYEYLGCYICWDMVVVDLLIGIFCNGCIMWIEVYNGCGEVIFEMIVECLVMVVDLKIDVKVVCCFDFIILLLVCVFMEEECLKMLMVFMVLCVIIDFFYLVEDFSFGFYGVFGYDFVF